MGKEAKKKGNIISGYTGVSVQPVGSSTTVVRDEYSGLNYLGTSNVRDIVRPATAQISTVLGTPVAIWPFVEVSGTSVEDYSRNTYNATASSNLSTWATKPSIQGKTPAYTFNGLSNSLRVGDYDSFTFSNGTTDSPFSVVFAAKFASSASFETIISKHDAGALQEWYVVKDSSNRLLVSLRDSANSKKIARYTNAAIPLGSWHTYVITYDGSSTSAGITIYVDGLPVAIASNDTGGYVAMSNTAAEVYIGTRGTGGSRWWYSGSMTWVEVAGTKPSADEVWSVHQLLSGLLGL